MFTLLSLVFGAFLWSVFLLGFFIIAMVLIEGFVRIVRLWKPDFFQSYTYKANSKNLQAERSERRMLAIDFVIQERIRRQNDARKLVQQQLLGSANKVIAVVTSPKPTPTAIEIPDEVSLDEIVGFVADPRPQPIQIEDHSAEYAVARLVNGKKRYLCEKMVKRLPSGHIKNTVLFAAIRDKAKRFDRASAQRLLTVLPSDCFIEAMNVHARVAERKANGFVIQGLETNASAEAGA